VYTTVDLVYTKINLRQKGGDVLGFLLKCPNCGRLFRAGFMALLMAFKKDCEVEIECPGCHKTFWIKSLREFETENDPDE